MIDAMLSMDFCRTASASTAAAAAPCRGCSAADPAACAAAEPTPNRDARACRSAALALQPRLQVCAHSFLMVALELDIMSSIRTPK